MLDESTHVYFGRMATVCLAPHPLCPNNVAVIDVEQV